MAKKRWEIKLGVQTLACYAETIEDARGIFDGHLTQYCNNLLEGILQKDEPEGVKIVDARAAPGA